MPDTPHSTLSGDELHGPFHYVQAADPTTVGAGKWWLDTTNPNQPILKWRNAGNTGWITVANVNALDTAYFHQFSTSNPHGVTKAQVGLGNVPNVDATARANHTGTQSADTVVDGTTNKAFTAAEKTKLAGVATGATANQADATLLARANHTGTQSLDTTTDSATRVAMTAAERTKLTGVATGATANDTDANLRNRATHTGTQSADTITDGTVNKTFSAAEEAKLAGIASGATANQPDAYLLARANHTGTQDASSIGSGVLAPARLGSGAPGPLTFLRGDGFWSEIAAGEGGGFEPGINRVVLTDDFLGGGSSSGTVGELGWQGAKVTVLNASPPDASYRGLIEVKSTAASADVGRLWLNGLESFAVDLDVEWRVRAGPNVTNVHARVGIADAWGGQPGAGVYLESLSGETTWFAVCRRSGVQTRVNTGASAAANAGLRFRIRKVGSLVIVNANGGADIQIGTNVPTTGFGQHGVQVDPTANQSRSLFVDFFQAIATNVGR